MTLDIDAWDPWTPRALADRLTGIGCPWYVAGGWALDLFHGEQTRHHEDLEIGIPAADFPRVAERFEDCRFYVPYEGELVAATSAMLEAEHQTWAWDPAGHAWRFDVFREPHDNETWICRRDERIRAPYTEIIEWTADGIPFLAPEIVLLFKAKHLRDKDSLDFQTAFPRLNPDRRRRLDDALALVHPVHPWRTVLSQ